MSKITISSHSGTHCDAPSHYSNNGHTVDQLELDVFIGECLVIDMLHIKSSIQYEDVKNIPLHERMLFRVKEYEESFVYFSECCIEYLGSHRVKLIGTNAISVDEYSSKLMKAHFSCLKHNIQIIEGLYLDNIKSGKYLFVGLPLKLVGCDASPIRAILI